MERVRRAAAAEEDTKTQAARCMDCGIPYCHNGCPVNNQIPDWNDLVYQRRLEDGGRQPALDQQLPRGDGPRLPGAVRSLLHAQHRRQAGHHQDHRMRHRRSRRGRKAGSCRSRRRRRPARRLPSSAPVRRALPPPSSSRAPATRCTSTRRTRKPGGLLVYGIPDFKMEKGIIARRVKQMEAEGVDVPLQRARRQGRLARTNWRARTTRCCSPAAPSSRSTSSPSRPGATSTASTTRWISCRSRTGASRASRSGRRRMRSRAKGKHVIVIGGGDTG